MPARQSWWGDRAASEPTPIPVTIRFAVDDTATAEPRFFVKNLEAKLPGVPRVGEAVRVPGTDFRTTVGTFRVEEVIYPLDGTVILQFRADFHTDADQHVADLLAAGFHEA